MLPKHRKTSSPNYRSEDELGAQKTPSLRGNEALA